MMDFRKKKKRKTESVSEKTEKKSALKRRKTHARESIIDEAAFDDAFELANAEFDRQDIAYEEQAPVQAETEYEPAPEWNAPYEPFEYVEPEMQDYYPAEEVYVDNEQFNELYALEQPSDEEIESFLLINPTRDMSVDEYLRSELGSDYGMFEEPEEPAAEVPEEIQEQPEELPPEEEPVREEVQPEPEEPVYSGIEGRDYDALLAYYTDGFDFDIHEDEPMPQPEETAADTDEKTPPQMPETVSKPKAVITGADYEILEAEFRPEVVEPEYEAEPEPETVEAEPELAEYETEPEPETVEAEPVLEELETEPEPETVEAEPELAEYEAEPEPETVEAEPVLEELETEPESETVEAEPVLAEYEAEPEPETVEAEPVLAEYEAEPEPETVEAEPVFAEYETEPEPETVEAESVFTEYEPDPDYFADLFGFIPENDEAEPVPEPEPEPAPEPEPEPEPEPQPNFDDILSEFAAAPDGYQWQDEDEIEEIKAEVHEEIYGTVQKSAISAMEKEARDYIARVRSKASVSTSPAESEPDSYGYGVDLDGLFAESADSADGTMRRGEFVGKTPEPEIDSRFNLGGKTIKRGLMYGATAIDQSADEDYKPKEQSEYTLSQWTAEYDDVNNIREEEDPDYGRKQSLFAGIKLPGLRRKKKTEEADYNSLGEEYSPSAQAFSDTDIGVNEYARSDEEAELGFGDGDPTEYELPEEEFSKKFDEEDMYFPPSFGEYVASLLASVFFRIKGYRKGDSADTMVDAGEEDLGEELNPAAASSYYNSFINAQKLRLRIAAGLLAILLYLSLELPVPGMLRYIPVTAAACFALQSAIMLLALDIVTKGILNFLRLRIGADSMAVFSCLLTGADALIVALSDSANLHLPLCAVSSVSVVGLMLASYLSTKGLRKAIRVPAIGQQFFSVTSEVRFKSKDMTLLKSVGSAKGFVRRTEEAAPDETFFLRVGMFVIPVCLLLALLTALVKKSYSDTIYICSAIFAPAVPFTALLAFALPFFFGSNRLFKSGAAIAGWSGLCDIGASKNLIITDRDLFPESCVHLTNVRIFADGDAKQVISYAGSMISASGSTAAACFSELMDENGCELKKVADFEYLSGGGMKGMIDGHTVLCGSTDFMRLMTIRIPYRLTDRTTVLLAIDGILYGIFSLDYEAMPQIRKALVDLVRSNRHPVFAVRDFNINPEMLHNAFDLPTDGYDFPPFVERFELAEPSERPDKRISAILCNEGLAPLTRTADLGHGMYVVTMANLVLTILGALLGVLRVTVLLITVGSVSIGSILSFMLLFTIPVAALSIYISVR